MTETASVFCNFWQLDHHTNHRRSRLSSIAYRATPPLPCQPTPFTTRAEVILTLTTPPLPLATLPSALRPPWRPGKTLPRPHHCCSLCRAPHEAGTRHEPLGGRDSYLPPAAPDLLRPPLPAPPDTGEAACPRPGRRLHRPGRAAGARAGSSRRSGSAARALPGSPARVLAASVRRRRPAHTRACASAGRIWRRDRRRGRKPALKPVPVAGCVRSWRAGRDWTGRGCRALRRGKGGLAAGGAAVGRGEVGAQRRCLAASGEWRSPPGAGSVSAVPSLGRGVPPPHRFRFLAQRRAGFAPEHRESLGWDPAGRVPLTLSSSTF